MTTPIPKPLVPFRSVLAICAAAILPMLLCACGTTNVSVSPEYSRGQRLRVAVLDFDYKAGQDQASIFWGAGSLQNAGQMVADGLAEELMKMPEFTIVERSRLKAVLEERKLTEAGLLSSGQLQEISDLAGIDALVTGTVGSAMGAQVVMFGNSQVAFTARCIRASDGVVLWSASITSEEGSSNVSKNLHNAIQSLGQEIRKKLR